MKNKFSILILILTLSLVGCTKQDSEIQNSSSNSDERENININKDKTYDRKDIKNKKEKVNKEIEAKNTELPAGEWFVGTDIASGRYSISTNSNSGEFYVYSNDIPVILEFLTSTGNVEDGVSKVEADLEDGFKIVIPDLDLVQFELIDYSLKNELSAGEHKVGRDIPSGKYNVTVVGTGVISIYESDGLPIIDETLSNQISEFSLTNLDVLLEDGQSIYISGIEKTIFEEIK